MKKLLLLALCAILSANVDARTLYVNAKRPNNTGNGLSAKKAKKTIQAAINVAKKGDTILVLPGTYAPIKTNNKKIAIKSTKGEKKTKICAKDECITLDLSKKGKRSDAWSWFKGGGTATKVKGFHCFPKLWGDSRQKAAMAIGGVVSHCSFSDYRFGCGTYRGYGRFGSTKVYYLTDYYPCLKMAAGTTFNDCKFVRQTPSDGSMADYLTGHSADYLKCTFQRCVFRENGFACAWSAFANCLIAENCDTGFYDSSLLNCTLSRNNGQWPSHIFFAQRTKMSNCILWNNFDCVEWDRYELSKSLFSTSNGNTFSNTFTDNRDPKFVNAAKGNYKLKKGSPCINKGKLTKKQKKLVGTKDLAGRKRIRGRAVDRGCYEY